ncbi:MAG: nucleotidyl transferase AbiEii/AbiGii toxin family protein [Candidatus Bathyarchaeia archaeon]
MEEYYVFVKKLVNAFESVKLDYAFTGALAVSFYGVPRTTTDVDVIIAVADETDLKRKITAALKQANLEVDERKIETALTSGYKIVTFKDKMTPYTVDIILSEAKLDKKSGKIGNLQTFIQSPEDLIAAKLRMIKATLPPERANKDKEDIKAILAFTKLNIIAIRKQAQKDKTLEILEALTT